MKKKIVMLFVSIFMVLGIVCGSLFISADTLFSSTTETSQSKEEDKQVKIQATGNWMDFATKNRPGGEGTYSNPYTISTAQQLADFMNMVNNAVYNTDTQLKYYDSYAKLTADIDLSEHYWTPIGLGDNTFRGNFDGNGHCISGIYLDSQHFDKKATSKLLYPIGLFGAVSNATIKNLEISDSTITAKREEYAIFCMGSVVGYAAGNLTLDNIIVGSSVKINLTGKFNASSSLAFASYVCLGGQVGITESLTATNCHNFGSFKIEDASLVSFGGVVGNVASKLNVSYCTNFSSISSTVYSSLYTFGFGGIIGSVSDGGTTISDCVNYGDIKLTPSSTSVKSGNIGGIAGIVLNNALINRCVNYGEMQGTTIVGGIVGRMGQKMETGQFLWWDWVDKSACENVVIANCIGYTKPTGDSKTGYICGEIHGKNSIKGCYVTTSSAGVGVWYYADGTSTREYSAYQPNEVCLWKPMYLYQHHYIKFFTDSNSYSDSAWHINNYDGTLKGFSISGWKNQVSCNYATSGWVMTPILYNRGYRNGIISSIPYSLVPASLLGKATLSTYYYRDSAGYIYSFDNDALDNENMKITNSQIVGDTVETVTLGYTNAQFYYIKGLRDCLVGTLQFSYNASNFKSKSASSSTTGVRNVAIDSDNYFNGARINNLYFDSGFNETAKFTVYFQSQAKTLNIRYKVGKYKSGSSSGSVDLANFIEFSYINTQNSKLADFVSVSGKQEQVYYKEKIDLDITPEYGFAVLYVLDRDANNVSDTFANYTIDSNGKLIEEQKVVSFGDVHSVYDAKSVSKNKPFVDVRRLGSVVTGVDIKPSTLASAEEDPAQGYGKTDVQYNYIYNKELIVYLIPIKYNTKMNITLDSLDGRKEGQESYFNKDLYAYKGEGGVEINSIKAVAESKTVCFASIGPTEIDNYVNTRYSEFFKYGYTYSLYAYCYQGDTTSQATNNSVARKINIISNENQLYNDGTIKNNGTILTDMKEILSKAIQTDADRKCLTLHIVVVREPIEYKINFVTMANSYTSPSIYKDVTAEGIAGETTLMVTRNGSKLTNTFNVDDKGANYFNELKWGYSKAGTSFTGSSTLVSNDVLRDDNQNLKTLAELVDAYIRTKCGGNVQSSYLADNTLTVYSYFTLQTYKLTYKLNIDGEDKNWTGAGVTVSFNATGSSGSIGDKSVYYYTPVTLSVGNLSNARFLGWYLDETDGTKLLSLSQTYKFLVNPNKVNHNRTQATNAYSVNLVAKYSRYNSNTNALKTAGSSKVLTVSSADDLLALSSSVSRGNTYAGYVIKQTANIDMSDKVFNPIGTSTYAFKGTYDGQNYIISNLKFVYNGSVGYTSYLYDVGLFGYTDGAVIKNLTIKDSNFTGFTNSGMFVANAKDTTLEHLNSFNCKLETSSILIYNIYGHFTADGRMTQDCTYDYINKFADAKKELSIAGVTEWIADVFRQKRANIGGLAGQMIGGVAYACSMNSDISNRFGISYFNGLVGSKDDAAKIVECCVENKNTTSGVDEFSVANSDENVENSYYRYGSSTKYVGTDLSGNIPTDKNVWFKLANGTWTLRVLYWN